MEARLGDAALEADGARTRPAACAGSGTRGCRRRGRRSVPGRPGPDSRRSSCDRHRHLIGRSRSCRAGPSYAAGASAIILDIGSQVHRAHALRRKNRSHMWENGAAALNRAAPRSSLVRVRHPRGPRRRHGPLPHSRQATARKGLRPMADSRQARDPLLREGPARPHPALQGLEAGDHPAHAREQHGERREAGGARHLRRHRQVRPQLGVVLRHRRRAQGARGRRDAGGAVRHAGGRVRDAQARAARGDGQHQHHEGHLADLLRPAGQEPHDVRAVHRRPVGVHRHAGRDPGHVRDVLGHRPQVLRRLARRPHPADGRRRAAWAATRRAP